MTIFVTEAQRDMVRQLLADRAAVNAACKAAGPDAYKAPQVQSYFANSNRTFAAFLSPLFDHALFIFGESIARQVCALYGDGHSPDTVKPEKLADTFAQLTRLVDPWLLEPRPAAKLAPVVVSKPLEARVAKLEFAALKAANADKLSHLVDKLFNVVASFDSVSAYFDLDIPYVPPDLDDYMAFGLSRMTIGHFDKPCCRGLNELETLLKLPVGSKDMRRYAAKYRAAKAFQWEHFEKFAKQRIAKMGDPDEAYRATYALGVAKRGGKNLYPNDEDAIHVRVFSDKRYAPDATLDEFAAMESAFNALRKDWYSHNRKADAAPLKATARIIG